MPQISPLGRMDPKVLGASLRAARVASGLTQADVATKLGMARTTVVAIESGKRVVRAEDIMRFAELYRRPVPELVGRTRVTANFTAQFRARELHSPPAQVDGSMAVYELQTLAEGYADLEAQLGAIEKRQFPSEYSIQGVSLRDAAEEVAVGERNRMSLGDGPAGNLRDRLEADNGLRVFQFEMPSKLAGLFVFSNDLGPCVAINVNHPEERRRWTLVHEYGHFLMHRYQADITILENKRLKAHREQIADAFAEHFLMPAAGLNRRFTAIKRSASSGVIVADLVRLAHLYGVSFQAMVIRLETLQRIPSGTWNRLKSSGFKVREAQEILGMSRKNEIERRFPSRYVSLAVQAYNQALVSEEQLTRLLRTDRITTRLIVERHWRAVCGEDDGEFLSLHLDPAIEMKGAK